MDREGVASVRTKAHRNNPIYNPFYKCVFKRRGFVGSMQVRGVPSHPTLRCMRTDAIPKGLTYGALRDHDCHFSTIHGPAGHPRNMKSQYLGIVHFTRQTSHAQPGLNADTASSRFSVCQSCHGSHCGLQYGYAESMHVPIHPLMLTPRLLQRLMLGH